MSRVQIPPPRPLQTIDRQLRTERAGRSRTRDIRGVGGAGRALREAVATPEGATAPSYELRGARGGRVLEARSAGSNPATPTTPDHRSTVANRTSGTIENPRHTGGRRRRPSAARGRRDAGGGDSPL